MAKKQIESLSSETVVLSDERTNDTSGRRFASAQRWAEILAAYPVSGLTQKQYAKQAGVNYHTLVSRLGRARINSDSKTGAPGAGALEAGALGAGASGERPEPGRLVPGFIEAILPSVGANVSTLEVVTTSGFIIRGADPVAVATLVRALCV